MALLEFPGYLTPLVDTLRESRNVKITLREILTHGKSGAFVGLVDCEGRYDGVFVLKAATLPEKRRDEIARHEEAVGLQAFSGAIPPVVDSLKTDSHYLLLIELAGSTRISWRPLIETLKIFGSGYELLARKLWTPSLFRFDNQNPVADILSASLGYKLIADQGGRIGKHIKEFLAPELAYSYSFVHLGDTLPNPLTFATGWQDLGIYLPEMRQLLGPRHGDCHSANLFVKSNVNAEVTDLILIDLAAFELDVPFFFDHAYCEIATLLRVFDGLGEFRWLQLAKALASEETSAVYSLDQAERSWALDVKRGREEALKLALSKYPNRVDDLHLQFWLAQVAASLAFVHKEPRVVTGSGGLSRDQYRQAFVWAAVFLNKFFSAANLRFPATDKLIPRVGLQVQISHAISSQEWDSVQGFDSRGFNILVLSPKARADISDFKDFLRVPWNLVIDLGVQGISTEIASMFSRSIRQSWPGGEPPDLHLLSRGTLWYFAYGREDISAAPPPTTLTDWRRTYFRLLDSLITKISEVAAPRSVRVLVVGEQFPPPLLRMICETLDASFGPALAPIVVATQQPTPPIEDSLAILTTSRAVLERLEAFSEPAGSAEIDEVWIPRRTDTVRLTKVSAELVKRVRKDLTIICRQLSSRTLPGRTFGIDFRRGLPVDWSELAQNLDVERDKLDQFARAVKQAFESSNATVNLLHEPSAGGTTLSRRLAWNLMDDYPVVSVDQLSSDLAGYLRDVFQFSGLPLFVLMESSVVSESAREELLRQLRDDNTRAVFLWVSRSYGEISGRAVLSARLDSEESKTFFEVYREQVDDPVTVRALQRLVSDPDLEEQRSPFFFGLTAFGENYFGLERLIENVLGPLETGARLLVADLALVSTYSSEGFPAAEFDELCHIHNGGIRPFAGPSPFAISTPSHIKVAHRLIATRCLRALSRSETDWRADIFLFSNTLLDHLRLLRDQNSERLKRMVDLLYITRDTKAALALDEDVQSGGIPRQGLFSPLIEDIGNVEVARALLKRVKDDWPEELHFAVHYARHLLYKQPREVDLAMRVLEPLESGIGARDDVVMHMIGMCHRVRMAATLERAIETNQKLSEIEESVKRDCKEALAKFKAAISINPTSEYGYVASIQTVSRLIRNSVELSEYDQPAEFLGDRRYRWCLELISEAEEHIYHLRHIPNSERSMRAQRAIAEWNHAYGNVDQLISGLRALANSSGDPGIRRALCNAIIAKHQRKFHQMPQADLRTIVLMADQNISRQGVTEFDLKLWLRAFRLLDGFDISVAIRRLIDWQRLNPSSIEPSFYLYVFYCLLWLNSKPKNRGYADESIRWLKVCRDNQPLGQRTWSYEWLSQVKGRYKIVSFVDLEFDPVRIFRDETLSRRKLDVLSRLEARVINYKGPQQATADLGHGLTLRFTPLEKIKKEHEGHTVSLIVSFSYDGIVGWDAQLS